MTDAATRYRELNDLRHLWRIVGTLDADGEDAVLEQLDDLWWELSDQERAEANLRAARRAVQALESGGVATRVQVTRGSGSLLSLDACGQTTAGTFPTTLVVLLVPGRCVRAAVAPPGRAGAVSIALPVRGRS